MEHLLDNGHIVYRAFHYNRKIEVIPYLIIRNPNYGLLLQINLNTFYTSPSSRFDLLDDEPTTEESAIEKLYLEIVESSERSKTNALEYEEKAKEILEIWRNTNAEKST